MPSLESQYKLFTDGEFIPSKGNKILEVFNPANGKKLAEITDASQEDVDLAVKAARKAFESYKKTTPAQRAKLLNHIADIIDANKEHLAKVETMDNGKPIRESLGVDLPFAAEHFRYFAGAILAEEGEANIINEEALSIILREPIGVVGQIIPWNFPFLMAAWKLAPALASGCTVVIKPSSDTSLSLLELMKLLKDILPKGIVNVITGKGSTCGEYLINHEGLDKLAFTGSTEVGREVAIAAAKKIIPATLELGGKSANIIFEDSDLDLAVDGAMLGILFNQGQVCCAGSRIFVQESFYDKFIAKAKEKFEKVKVGDPLDPTTQMGSQINKKQVEKILSYIKIGEEEGNKLLVGGKSLGGNYIAPTLFLASDNDCRLCQEEIFGPVGVVIKFKDEDELIKMVNDSPYGLGGGIFTKDITRALRIAREMETGRVWINCYNQIPAGSPFGGYKQSGIGRETHKMILGNYSQVKNIYIDLKAKASNLY